MYRYHAQGDEVARASVRAWRAGARSAVLACVTVTAVACALGTPAPPPLPGAARRPVDIYVPAPATAPSGPLLSGDAAVERALANDTLLRHLQMIDSRYSGRRRRTLNWSARAAFTQRIPEQAARAEGDGSDGEISEASALESAVTADGGYWEVAVESDVRETRIFYVCLLRFTKGGEYLAPFDTRRGCVWESR
jgi:hypothetical protein